MTSPREHDLNPEPAKPLVMRWPRSLAAFLALFAGVQTFGLGSGALRVFLELQDHRTAILGAGLLTGLAGAIAAYLLFAHLLGAAMPMRAVRASALALALFVAFMAGEVTTLVAFGKNSPWGYVVDGISGPLTDGFLNGAVSSAWWPMPFAFGVLITLLVARWLWDVAKKSGADCDPVFRPHSA